MAGELTGVRGCDRYVMDQPSRAIHDARDGLRSPQLRCYVDLATASRLPSRGAVALSLLHWHKVHGFDRGLPWRASSQGARPALVEGLLAQTRAEAVAAHYASIFRGVWSAGDWACVSHKAARVAPLGLPRAKVAAMDGIAACLLAHATTWQDLVTTPGVGPYTAAMVAVLHGHAAAPVDCNVERVALRMGAGQWDAAAWVWALVAEVAPRDRYALVSALLDLGATVCTAQTVDCERCPVAGACVWPQKRHQLRLL